MYVFTVFIRLEICVIRANRPLDSVGPVDTGDKVMKRGRASNRGFHRSARHVNPRNNFAPFRGGIRF